MYLVRIDNRLVHGQVIESWIPYARTCTLVVGCDSLADDALRQEIMCLAIPHAVETVFLCVEQVAGYVKEYGSARQRDELLILFADCQDAQRACEKGLPVEVLNIGNLHYSPGKEQVCTHVALSGEDRLCLRYFSRAGIALDFRAVPNETVEVPLSW